MKTLLLLITTIFIFTGCSFKNEVFKPLKNDILEPNLKHKIKNKFNSEDTLLKFFKPWDIKSFPYTEKQISWGIMYKKKKVYGENHRLIEEKWFDKNLDNSNYKNLNNLKLKGITVKNTNVRVFPTNSVIFYNPKNPGEGFPFDYNQNSSLKINSPIFISHLSKDKRWALISNNSFGGWVKTEDIAYVDNDFIKEFKNNNYFITIKDNLPIHFKDNFIEYIKIGTLLPSNENGLILSSKKLDNYRRIIYSDQKKYIKSFPLKFNKENILKLSQEFLEEPYGWGGILNNRDCSQFTQDFFFTFGKYLNRNSRGQKLNGKYLNLTMLNNNIKKDFIIKNAKPFETLVYMNGHIMIYVGKNKNNQPIIMHNIWSLKLKDIYGNKYREIIGKNVITTLEPGKKLYDYDKENSLLNRIKGIIIF